MIITHELPVRLIHPLIRRSGTIGHTNDTTVNIKNKKSSRYTERVSGVERQDTSIGGHTKGNADIEDQKVSKSSERD